MRDLWWYKLRHLRGGLTKVKLSLSALGLETKKTGMELMNEGPTFEDLAKGGKRLEGGNGSFQDLPSRWKVGWVSW